MPPLIGGTSAARVKNVSLRGLLVALVGRPPFPVVRLLAVMPFWGLRKSLLFVRTSKRVVALTLDDGPHPETTWAVLRVLASHGAHATFFLLGSRAEEHPELVERIAAEGHELGNHTWRDESSADLSKKRFRESLRRTHRVLSPFGPVRLFRPGGGRPSRRIVAEAKKLRYRCVLASVYPHDVRVPWRWWIVRDIRRRVRPGAIIVVHEGTPERSGIATTLDEVLTQLERRGYRITTVSDLLAAAGS